MSWVFLGYEKPAPKISAQWYRNRGSPEGFEDIISSASLIRVMSDNICCDKIAKTVWRTQLREDTAKLQVRGHSLCSNSFNNDWSWPPLKNMSLIFPQTLRRVKTFHHYRDDLSSGQRQRSGSAEAGQTAGLRTLDPEPISFLTPSVSVERQTGAFLSTLSGWGHGEP